MIHENDHTNEECEYVLAQLCYLRERYPIKCSNNFEECLLIKNRISMTPLHSPIRKTTRCASLAEQHAMLLEKIPSTHKENKKIINAKALNLKIDNLIVLINQMQTLKPK
ncbi:uncharacterized protein LOC123270804 [Cotesia glomerata]|uniref:Uncharacterized protein n=1 Tax=Cotesia glomerata TaxID=32391 RepID=A0AAV7J807_COTGL|nr:uncharacterized protein LOC123270804 [Cotesia glomerata]KAH0567997.1 hypothetical protein KQX54_017213 [Cotesia glomerata]